MESVRIVNHSADERDLMPMPGGLNACPDESGICSESNAGLPLVALIPAL
jgi:hypothetical protein